MLDRYVCLPEEHSRRSVNAFFTRKAAQMTVGCLSAAFVKPTELDRFRINKCFINSFHRATDDLLILEI